MTHSPSARATENRTGGEMYVALGMGLVAFGCLYATAASIGYARDEGFYFYAAGRYGAWLELLYSDPMRALSRDAVDAHFAVNSEHPALMKLLFAGADLGLRKSLGLALSPGQSARLVAMWMASLSVSITVGWAARLLNWRAGVMAGLLLLTMPRWFHHAHLACFDVPVATMLLLCTALYSRAVHRKTLGSAILLAIAYGLTLDTKHNAWWLPGVFALHLGLTEGGALRRLKRAEVWLRLRPLAWMCVLGPLVLILLWPWLWYDTLGRIEAWFRFHLNHEYYNMQFLGPTYHKPPMPRGYAWVMTLATVPATTLCLAIVGMGVSVWHAIMSLKVRAANASRPSGSPVGALSGEAPATPSSGSLPLTSLSKMTVSLALQKVSMAPAAPAGTSPARLTLLPTSVSPRSSTELLFWLSLLSAYAPWWFASTPIFGGTKHWLAAYPYLCLFAARGYVLWGSQLHQWLAAKTSGKRLVQACERAGTLLLLAPSAFMTAMSVPFGLSAYTPLVGGAPGAATLGLNRTFWGYTSIEMADVFRELAPRGARVFVHDTALQSWQMHQTEGTFARELVPTLNIAQSELALLHYEPHMLRVEYQIWEAYGTTSPEAIACYDGVPVLWLYARPR